MSTKRSEPKVKLPPKPRASKGPNYWMKALKEVNKDKDTWCIPKKDSEMYKEVKKIEKKLREPELEQKGIPFVNVEPYKYEDPSGKYKKKTETLAQRVKKVKYNLDMEEKRKAGKLVEIPSKTVSRTRPKKLVIVDDSD